MSYFLFETDVYTKPTKPVVVSAFLTATGFVGFLSHPEDIGEADAADANPKENALNEGTEAYAAQRVSG